MLFKLQRMIAGSLLTVFVPHLCMSPVVDFDACWGLHDRDEYEQADRNGDGVLSKEEFVRRLDTLDDMCDMCTARVAARWWSHEVVRWCGDRCNIYRTGVLRGGGVVMHSQQTSGQSNERHAGATCAHGRGPAHACCCAGRCAGRSLVRRPRWRAGPCG